MSADTNESTQPVGLGAMTGSALRFMVRERDETIENLCRALDDLLPPHMMACCDRGSDGQFLFDECGKGLITEQSCRCDDRIKEYRRLLGRQRNSRKALPCNSAERDLPNDKAQP